MALESIKYITKNEYTEDNYSGTAQVLEERNIDIEHYFKLKTRYFTELINLKGKPKNIISKIDHSDGSAPITTTYPLIFFESDGEYIINIVNDIAPYDILYSKKISTNKSINVTERLSEISNVIQENNFVINKWNIFNKIEGLRKDKLELEMLTENNMINNSEKLLKEAIQNKEMDKLRGDYTQLKNRNSSLNIQYNILNDLVTEFVRSKVVKISNYSLDLINENKQSKDMFGKILKDIETDEDRDIIKRLLIDYHMKYKLINQDGSNNATDIVFYRDTVEEGFIKIGVLHTGIQKDESTNVKVMTEDGGLKEVQSENIKKIIGLNSLLENIIIDLDNFTISYEKYRQIVLQTYPERLDILPEYSKNITIKRNYDGSLSKKSVNYFYNLPESGKLSVKKRFQRKKTKKKADPIESIKTTINIVPDKLLFSEEDIFMFYSNSRDANPGIGTSEKKTSDDDYDNLNVIKNWRKNLSNFHISRDEGGTIIPIIIDGMPFASVEHYFHFSKFWNVTEYKGAKRQQYNNHAMKFRLDYKGNDGWGHLDSVLAKTNGGKSSGLMHRPDWLKPINGITSETIDKQYGGGNFITLRDYILTKGNFAKFNQIDDMKNTLLYTGMAKLIHPEGGSPRSGKYELVFHLMYVRYLIKNNKPLFNYDNFDYDKDMINTLIKKHISVILLDKMILNKDAELTKPNYKKNILNELSVHAGFNFDFMKKNVKNEIKENIERFQLTPESMTEHFNTTIRENDLKLNSIETPYFKTNIISDEQDYSELEQVQPESTIYKSVTGVHMSDDSTEQYLARPIEGQKHLFRRFKQSVDEGRPDEKIYEELLRNRPKEIEEEQFVTTMEHAMDGDFTDSVYDQLLRREEGTYKDAYSEGYSEKAHEVLLRRYKESVHRGIPDEQIYEELLRNRPKDIEESEFITEMEYIKKDLHDELLQGKESELTGIGDYLETYPKEEQYEGEEQYEDEYHLLLKRFKHSVEIGRPDQKIYEELLRNRPKEIEEEQFLAHMDEAMRGNFDDTLFEELMSQMSKDVSGKDKIIILGKEKYDKPKSPPKLSPNPLSDETSYSKQLKYVKKTSITSNPALLSEIERFNGYIKQLDKLVYNVPPDGDCGYYSVVEMMAYNNIYPLNFAEQEEHSYQSAREDMVVSFSGEKETKKILRRAMLELRRDVAIKFKNNISYTETQSAEIESIKATIVSGQNSTGSKYNEINHDKYEKSISNSTQNPDDKGDWISAVELGIISALFNINIIVHNSNSTTTEYLANEYIKIYPAPPSKNIGAKPKTIEIGYIANVHYVGVTPNNTSESELETITYHTISLETDEETIIEFAFDLIKKLDDQGGINIKLVPLGIYNSETHVINDLRSYSREYQKSIIAKLTFYSQNNEINFDTIQNEGLYTPINYYRDISTNVIYKESDKLIELGHLAIRTKKGRDTPYIKFNEE